MGKTQHVALNGPERCSDGNAMTESSLLFLKGAQVLHAISCRSLQDLADARCRFIPRHVIFETISPGVMLDYLQSSSPLPSEQQQDLRSVQQQDVVARICPPINECRCGHRYCTGGRIIFAASLSLFKPELIELLFQESRTFVCDADLALLSDEKGDCCLEELLRQTLSSQELERFIHFTWQMRSPIIENMSHHDSDAVEPTLESFPTNVSLPLIEMSGDCHEEVTTVCRIVIHPAHIGAYGIEGDLALKTFSNEYRTERLYKREVTANRRIPQHERIVPLLAAFKHREKFHLLFPWARGGNLADLFQKYTTPKATVESGGVVASWYSEDWLVAECLGLADGLAAVHEASSAHIHADIKPENILCFASSDEDIHGFTLKLADFGEAQEVDQLTKTITVQRVSHTKTYRPPEHDTKDILDLKYDIWCLGCVLLEFITWAIAGVEAVDLFSEERLEELDDRKATTAMGLILTDTFFRKSSERAGLGLRPRINVMHSIQTYDSRDLPRSALRRRHQWGIEYTGNTRVKAVLKSEVTRVSSYTWHIPYYVKPSATPACYPFQHR